MKAQPEAILAHYIVETRGKGPFLSTDEYLVLRRWLNIEKDIDQILLILSEVFSAETSKGQTAAAKPLTYYENLVCKRLRDRIIARI